MEFRKFWLGWIRIVQGINQKGRLQLEFVLTCFDKKVNQPKQLTTSGERNHHPLVLLIIDIHHHHFLWTSEAALFSTWMPPYQQPWNYGKILRKNKNNENSSLDFRGLHLALVQTLNLSLRDKLELTYLTSHKNHQQSLKITNNP